MKAIVQERYGGADVVAVHEVARPDIGDDELLVQVMAAGVDRGALHLMTGRPYLMRLGTGLRAPRVAVPGVNFAGRVAAIGTNVTRFEPADEVYGSTRRAYAEFVATPPTRSPAWKPGSDTSGSFSRCDVGSPPAGPRWPARRAPGTGTRRNRRRDRLGADQTMATPSQTTATSEAEENAMSTSYPMYPDLARLEIEQRLRAAAAERRGRLARHGIGIARGRTHMHDDRRRATCP
jgi:Alcohol dehydrogenase GroES-like domain